MIPEVQPTHNALHAFSAYGIELEFMIVDRDSLSVRPITDRLLRGPDGEVCNDLARGMFGWSNEFVLHVVEIKNRRPTASLRMLPEAFQSEVRQIDRLLEAFNARLMPTAMHPWMDPRKETRLWRHGNEAIYKAYDRIFDCRSHGWANLQSMHLNLPFANDTEFARLHAAVRLALPILPALAASSPIVEGRNARCADYRMRTYCGNSEGIPSIAGAVVPETVSSRAEYEHTILAPMYRDIAPHDPERVLQHEWLNSRGAIARFDRNTIEIRVIDTQECPRADMAVAAATVYVVRTLYRAQHASLQEQQAVPTATLARILNACICDAEQAVIDVPEYLALLGYPDGRCSAQELWTHLIERMLHDGAEHADPWREPLQTILRQGPLARRILHAIGSDYAPAHLAEVYRELCDCLHGGRLFEARPR